ncbi:MAG TPA: YggS family pyridoxal phosphate-dependent enzyme [Mycobacteriales bacterium]
MAQLSEDPRTAQLAANLAEVRDRIARAARDVGRDPGEVALIAVTKTFDADDVRRLAALGIAEFGENRDQEAAPKAAAVPDVRWHFLGRIQRNKIRSIASYADSVDSVDRTVLVDPLDRAVADRAIADRAAAQSAPLDVLVQVSLDGDPARGGVRAADLPALADRVEAAEHLRLAGLMAVAPLGGDVERSYADLADLAARIRAAHPQARALSAGMSGDLEAAVRHGSTQVRVGTALLGGRPPVVR